MSNTSLLVDEGLLPKLKEFVIKEISHTREKVIQNQQGQVPKETSRPLASRRLVGIWEDAFQPWDPGEDERMGCRGEAGGKGADGLWGWAVSMGEGEGGGWREGEVRWQPCTGPDWGGLGGGTQWGKP